MRVIYFNPYLDSRARPPLELLRAWPTLCDVPEVIAAAGGSVTVVQAAHESQNFTRGDVNYEFVDARDNGPARLAAAAGALDPEVVHFNGFAFPHHLLALRAVLPACPLIIQDHGDRPPRSWKRPLWRRALSCCDATAFMSAAQAEPFVRAGVLDTTNPVFAVPETAVRFTTGDRVAAREALRLTGKPCIVTIARLNANKDPLTTVRAFDLVAARLDDAHLWILHDGGPLLSAVRQRAHERIHLLERLPHERVELLLRAADIYVSASHSEGSGYAVMEALACGTPALLSDIPAHRAILGGSGAGRLFRTGDAGALADAVLDAAPYARSTRDDVRAHFDAALSPRAVGHRLMHTYAQLRARPQSVASRRLRVALVVPGGVDRSGVERVIPRFLWLIERLARSVDLHVIALRQEPVACTYDLLGATVHCIPSGATRLQALRHLLHLQRMHRFDVLHALWMHPQGTLAGALGMLTRTPVLLHLEGGDLAALPEIAFGGRRNVRGRMWLRVATQAAARITVSSRLLQRSAAALGINAELISFGIATDRWPVLRPRPRDTALPARLLHVGTINRVKDQQTLLHALSHLRQRGIAFHADLIGEDLVDGEIQSLVDALALHDCVAVHGWKSHEDVRPFFESAHVHLVSSRYEGGPFAAHEAAATGVPTVGTAVGDLIDWAPDAALTVGTGDAAALGDALHTLLTDEPRRMQLAHAAQTRAVAVDADASAARVLEIYRDLVTQAPRRTVSRTAARLPALPR